MFCYRSDAVFSLYSLVSAGEEMMWPSSREANIHHQLEVVPLTSIRTIWHEQRYLPKIPVTFEARIASRPRGSNGPRCGWESLPLPAQLPRPGAVLVYTVSHPVKSFHIWCDATWQNMFGGLRECYLCVHRHWAPAPEPEHAGSNSGDQCTGLFFSFGGLHWGIVMNHFSLTLHNSYQES